MVRPNGNAGYRDFYNGLDLGVAPRQKFKCGVLRSGDIISGYDDCQ